MGISKERKKEIEELKDRALELCVMGYTQKQIGKQIGKTERQVANYLKDRKIKIGNREIIESAKEKIAQLKENQLKRIRSLWSIALDKESTKSVRLKALGLLKDEDEMFVKRGQLAGILKPDGPVVAIQNNTQIDMNYTITDAFRELHPELVDNFNKVKKIQNVTTKKRES